MNKYINKKLILTAIFIFTLAVGFGLGKVEKASALNCTCGKASLTTCDHDITTQQDQPDIAACVDYCKNKIAGFNCLFFNNSTYSTNNNWTDYINRTPKPSQSPSSSGGKSEEICPGLGFGSFFSSPLTSVINCILIVILRFLGLILSAIATLFANVIDVGVFGKVVGNNPVIYEVWGVVRDFLNISFILVLLFSAFCTVFQVQKFNYKNILLTLIIMALLVNFSFPISRVIVDFSNVMMYSLVQSFHINTGSGLLVSFAKGSALDRIIYGADITASSPFLLASVVFVFIFTVTIFVMTILFLIRLVMLAFLIMFSPVAFVGSIVPFLSTHASKWWDNLFKYAFFGPIMMFMIAVATKMMVSIQSLGGSFQSIGTKQSTDGAAVITYMAFFFLPIAILWAGMGIAQSMSIMGASAVVGRGQKFMIGAGKKFSGIGFATGAWGAYQTRRKEADKDSWRNRLGTGAGSLQDRLRGVIPGKTGRDAALRYQRDQAAKIKKAYDQNNMADKSVGDLENMAKNGRDKYERTAATIALAEKGRATTEGMENVRKAFGETSQVFEQLVSKVKIFDPATAFAHITNATKRKARKEELINSNQFDANKILANSWDDDELVDLMFKNNAVSPKNILDIAKTSKGKADKIDAVLGRLTKARTDNTKDMDRNIHMAHFARSGEIANDTFADHITEKMDGDMAANMKMDTVNKYSELIARKNKSFKKVAANIKDDNVTRQFVNNIKAYESKLDDMDDPLYMSALPANHPYHKITDSEKIRARSAAKIAKTDPQLRAYR
jgi:hypothetical protein